MRPDELTALLDMILRRRCEMQNIELKKAGKGTPTKLYDTLSAFANQKDGGTIVFGLDEKDNYTVTGVYDAQDLQVQVTNAALQLEPVVRPVFTVVEYMGKTIVSAEIPECEPENKPCFYRAAGRIRGSYVRVGDADLPMTEYEIYAYEVYRKKIRDELRTVDRAELSDLSGNLLAAYFAKLREEKPVLVAKAESDVLRLQGMTVQGKPTVAGMMLLCDYPQAFFPQLSITAMVVDGTEIGLTTANRARFIDNRRLEGTIPQMLESAVNFVRRNIRNAVIIHENGSREDRPEYPMVAVREIILNALIHRDYSIYTEDSPIRVILYRDRLVVENPGGLYGRLSINDLGKLPADTRNPFIAGSLEVMINTENRFSGIPTIYEEMSRAGLQPPVFESIRGNFRVTLYNARAEKPAEASDGKSTEENILAFCKKPKSKAEISEYLGIATQYYVMKQYIRPLLEKNMLKMTIPDKPGSRNQKYYTADD